MTQYPAQPADPRVAFHEVATRETGHYATDDEVTRELRSLGPILSPVSEDQRKQLDHIAGLTPHNKGQKRRLKKAQKK